MFKKLRDLKCCGKEQVVVNKKSCLNDLVNKQKLWYTSYVKKLFFIKVTVKQVVFESFGKQPVVLKSRFVVKQFVVACCG